MELYCYWITFSIYNNCAFTLWVTPCDLSVMLLSMFIHNSVSYRVRWNLDGSIWDYWTSRCGLRKKVWWFWHVCPLQNWCRCYTVSFHYLLATLTSIAPVQHQKQISFWDDWGKLALTLLPAANWNTFFLSSVRSCGNEITKSYKISYILKLIKHAITFSLFRSQPQPWLTVWSCIRSWLLVNLRDLAMDCR